MEKIQQSKHTTSERLVQVFLLILIVIGIGLLLTQSLWVPRIVEFLMRNDVSEASISDEVTQSKLPDSHRDLTHMVDNRIVEMKDGYSEIPAALDSATKIITRHFGNEATGDIDNDGVLDAVFLLTQEGGGTGTFFYVAAARKTPDGYIGTNAVLLGDRIAPQSTVIKEGIITVNYAERNPDESMAVSPSVGVSKSFVMKNGTLFAAP